jgi:sulfate permease, SulP family
LEGLKSTDCSNKQEGNVTQASYRKIPSWLQEEIGAGQLLPGLMTGALFGFTEVVFALSLGSLVFSGELARYLPFGIGIALTTAAVMMIGTALLSKVPGVISSAQDSPSVVMAVIVAGLVATLSAVGMQEKLITVLVAIAITTLLTGVFFVALGFFKLGGLVRFIPYPVVGGFLAGTGWLLVQGSFGVIADLLLTLGNIPALLQTAKLLVWVPGVLFALILFFGLRRLRHSLAMPGILVGSIILFYLALLVTHTSINSAIDRGLLLGSISGETVWQPLTLQHLLAANFPAILRQSGNIAILLILSVVSLLLNASALELSIRRDIDFNRELQAAGFANIISGLGGGMVGYHALSLSTLSYRMGARGKLPGIIAGSICAVMLFAGSALLAYFPKPILGGLLLYLGLEFLYEWVIAGWSKLSRADYAVVILILVVIALTNFLIGLGVGLVAAIILFVLSYSRIDVVHHALSGAEMRSNVERCAYHQRSLASLGKQIFILELQGFIFFGTSNALLEKIRSRVADTTQDPLHYIILDFRRVSGLDSSAVLSFIKGRQLVSGQGITLVLTHLSENIKRSFDQGGLLKSDPIDQAGEGLRIFHDLDHGLEWCEEQLLEQERITLMHVPVTLSAQLFDSGFEKANTARLMKYLESVKIEPGEYLIQQGEDADKLYFIVLGSVSIYLEMGDGKQVRLQTLGLGTAVGEPGLYLGAPCTASAIADTPVSAYRLTRDKLSEMTEKDPRLAATFHEFAARLLSERLAATTRTLEAVLR